VNWREIQSNVLKKRHYNQNDYSLEFTHLIISLLLGPILFLQPYRVFCLFIFFNSNREQLSVTVEEDKEDKSDSEEDWREIAIKETKL